MGARVTVIAALAVLLSTLTSLAGEVVVRSVQRSCAARLQAVTHAQGEYNYKVVREQRENTKRLESLDLPDYRRTLLNTYLTYPLIRSIANRRIGADNEFVTHLHESEFSFQHLTLIPTDDTGALVLIRGRVLMGERTFEFSVDGEVVLEKGSWEGFKQGKPTQFAFTESGACALERALLGGENSLTPAACAHLVQYIRGAYGDLPPIDVDYSSEQPTPLLTGTIKAMEFSGFSLNELVTVRFGASDPSGSEAE
ncbi:MAG: hypothetical protein KDD51_12385 [Bdellovibrionales bacterium]|nr:hypothetical protein [Bdellovibrionales bacterium]